MPPHVFACTGFILYYTGRYLDDQLSSVKIADCVFDHHDGMVSSSLFYITMRSYIIIRNIRPIVIIMGNSGAY
jgi:hypothetical protein